MRAPWNALTRILADWPLAEPQEGVRAGGVDAAADLDGALAEAWTETAARLGLVRLGWFDDRARARLALAYPGQRAIVRTLDPDWVVRFGLGLPAGVVPAAGPFGRRWAPGSEPLGAELAVAPAERALEARAAVALGDGLLVVAAEDGRLPTMRELRELATLAAAVCRVRSLADEARRERKLVAQGRAVAAAGHDLRNELTRALLLAARGAPDDAAGVLASLRAARDLAQSSLTSETALIGGRVEPLDLHALLVEEARAASAAARVPAGQLPTLRLRCQRGLRVLGEAATLGRAVRNLVLNALEAASSGESPGTVSLRARVLECDAAGFSVRVDVHDDGRGMAPAGVARYLSPGRSGGGLGGGLDGGGSRPTSEHGKPASTGLGTASLRHALLAGGVPLRVESAPSRGTTVSLALRQPPVGRVSLVVDPDARRRRRVVEDATTPSWGVAGPAGALPLLDRDLVQRVLCARASVDPASRAGLERACRRAGLPMEFTGAAVPR